MQGTTRPHTAGALGYHMLPLRQTWHCARASIPTTARHAHVARAASALPRCSSMMVPQQPCFSTGSCARCMSSMAPVRVVSHAQQPARRCNVIARARTGECSDYERSSMVHEELVYFLFQLEMDVQLARALNHEAYEQATVIRAKRQQVDEALEAIRAKKEAGGKPAEKVLSAADIAAEGLRLRTAMQRAVEAENYKEAAALRDQLAMLQTKAAQSEAMSALVSGRVQPKLRLGQRVWHKQHAYRGVVVGWDGKCCEGEDWVAWLQKSSGEAAPRQDQPFYHLLVDQRDWPYDPSQSPVAYVAEELLWAPDQGGPIPAPVWAKVLRGEVECELEQAQQSQKSGTTPSGAAQAPQPAPPVLEPDSGWADVFGKDDGLKHPYGYMLFLGMDAQGDYLPCRQLRDKYSVARRDVFPTKRSGEDIGEDEAHNNEDN